MITLDLVAAVLRALAFVALYFFIGFGPGFILGLLLANATSGRGKPMLMDSHNDSKIRAAQHNAQWAPSHPRWHT